MLVADGLVRAQASDGREFTFTPSLARIADLGTPRGIVELYVALHGPHAVAEAEYVLHSLCDQDDPTPLLGGVLIDPDDAAKPERVVAGQMPDSEKVILARHLMQHGIVGKATPNRAGDGKFAEEFHAGECIALARVHLGLSAAEAGALSMTELQTLFDLKFPDAARKRDVPTREEYEALMARLKERRGG